MPRRTMQSGRALRRHRPINLSRDAFRHLAAALGIAALLSATAARADWKLLGADQAELPHLTINTWTPAEGLSANEESGKLTTVATRDIVSLSSGREIVANPDARDWKLTLRNGDVFYGVATGVSGQSLVFKTPELGNVTIPLKYAARLSAPWYGPEGKPAAEAALAGATDHDVIIFKGNTDRLEGLFNKIDANKVQIISEAAGGADAGAAGGAGGAESTTDIALSKVQTIVFGGVKTPRAVPPLSARLTFHSGTVMTVPLEGGKNAFSWTIDSVAIQDPGGNVLKADVDQIVNVEVLGGRVVYLTELDPAHEEQVSFFGTDWPAQVNKNVMGQPLRVARTTYGRGLGVHTQSTLVYELDGSFETLSLRVGMDDSAAPQGEAHAYIVLDGKTLWDGKVIKPGEVSPVLSLAVKGGRRLELHADPAARLDVLGRVDWLDAALRRK